jgi:hypothetical protein
LSLNETEGGTKSCATGADDNGIVLVVDDCKKNGTH